MCSGHHCLCIFEDRWDAYTVTFGWIYKFLQRKNTAVIYAAETNIQKILDFMNKTGIDADYHLENGRLSLLNVDNWYGKRNGFDAKKIVSAYINLVDHLIQEGYNSILVIGSGTSFFKRGKITQLMDYEQILDRRFEYNLSAICCYNIKSIYTLGFGQLVSILLSHSSITLQDQQIINLDVNKILDSTLKETFEDEMGPNTARLIVNSIYQSTNTSNSTIAKKAFDIEQHICRLLGRSSEVIFSDLRESILKKIDFLMKNNV